MFCISIMGCKASIRHGLLKREVDVVKTYFGICGLLFAMISHAQSLEEERLSTWLFRHQTPNDYLSGLMWLVPQEKKDQSALKNHLCEELRWYQRHANTAQSKANFAQLITTVQNLPVTGRALISIPDPLWLEIHPAQDPILRSDQSAYVPEQPKSITVLLEDGSLCQPLFIPGATALTYIKQCLGNHVAVDYAWIAQPDGRARYYGVALWNEQRQDPLMPGAWLWAPQRSKKISKSFSNQFINFLGTQGVAAEDPKAIPLYEQPVKAHKLRDSEYTANDWGMTGLIHMPSARMEQEGEVRFQGTHLYPYNIGTIVFQPFSWLEGGFRYTNIRNVPYGRRISKLSTIDKSLDIKLKLWRESAYFPELAIGGQDIVGTGLFSGEYLVASKRSGNFDWTLGLGWGYLGAQANLTNPLNLWGSQFNSRIKKKTYGGGHFDLAYFRGSTSLFGGLQWHTPWDPLLIKLEYSSSQYQSLSSDAQSKIQTSPINIGLVYRVNSILDVMSAYERGNTFMLGFTLHTALNKLKQVKFFDPPSPPVTTEMPQTMPDWSRTTADIRSLTGWSVRNIKIEGNSLIVRIENSFNSYGGPRFERVISVLHRDAPAYITKFVLVFGEYGMKLDAKEVNRALWVDHHLELYPPSLITPSIQSVPPIKSATKKSDFFLWNSKQSRFSGGIWPSFSQIVGGPDAYMLYQAGLFAGGEFRLTNSSFISGTVAQRLFDNYKNFVYDGPSNLPRVRTDMRQYILTSSTTIANLQITHMQQISDNQFVSIYGGLLEPMFAGIGAEWLYRPWHGPLALGVDFNTVQQRGYAQNFQLQQYKVNTGQVTLYWDMGWNGLLMQLSAGQYLAGDRGVQLDLSRRFHNGIIIGAYMSKTNVTALEFGEGGFNKGVYLSIPFDNILPVSTPGYAYFQWQPLVRDGGAELNRSYSLYEMTTARR